MGIFQCHVSFQGCTFHKPLANGLSIPVGTVGMEIFQCHDTFRGCNLLFCCGISFQVVFVAPSFANCGSPIKMDDFFEKGKFDGSNFRDSEQGRPKQNCAMCTMATTFFWCGLPFFSDGTFLNGLF